MPSAGPKNLPPMRRPPASEELTYCSAPSA